MKKLYLGMAASALALSLFGAGAASAAIVLTTGNIGGTGIHSSTDADQTGSPVYGTVGIAGELVTFTSSESLSLNGAGEAVIAATDGSLSDLNVDFISDYSIVGFNIELPGGKAPDGGFAMTLVVNGDPLNFTFLVDPLAPPQKYILTATGGDVIQNLQFTFDPAVKDTKQFRLTVADDGNPGPGGGPVPEPATWAMMLLGFGGMGAILRRRRQAAFA